MYTTCDWCSSRCLGKAKVVEGGILKEIQTVPSYTAIITDQQCVFICGCGWVFTSSAAYVVRILYTNEKNMLECPCHMYVYVWPGVGSLTVLYSEGAIEAVCSASAVVWILCLIQCHVYCSTTVKRPKLWLSIYDFSSTNKQHSLTMMDMYLH